MKAAGTGRRGRPRASGKSFVVNRSQTSLFHLGNKDSLSVMRVLNPEDDISWNESSPRQAALEDTAELFEGKTRKTGLEEKGPVGGM